MDSNLVTAGAAVMGSLVGAVASFASTWVTQSDQSRRDCLSRQLTRRESLYAEFIDEAAQRYSDALTHNIDNPESLSKLWSVLSRIRLSATVPVLAEAEKAMSTIADQFSAKNLSLAEARELLRQGDPLKGFSEACRAELDDIDTNR